MSASKSLPFWKSQSFTNNSRCLSSLSSQRTPGQPTWPRKTRWALIALEGSVIGAEDDERDERRRAGERSKEVGVKGRWGAGAGAEASYLPLCRSLLAPFLSSLVPMVYLLVKGC
jgi:hypothetical protein